MRDSRWALPLLLWLGALTSFATPSATQEGNATSAAVARAEAAAQALGKDLLERLGGELRAGSAADAVRVCSEAAPRLAAAHSGDGLTVRRVSLEPRNPANAPDDLERELLVELQTLHDEGRRPGAVTRIVETDGGRELRWLRPILIASTCLRCHGHGDEIDAGVRRVLEESYPEDRATGYEIGDLRGAFSVTVTIE